MYRRGQYYKRKHSFPLFPKEALVIISVIVLGGSAAYGLFSKSGGVDGVSSAYRRWQFSRQERLDQRRQGAQAQAGVLVVTGTATATAGTATVSVGTTASTSDLTDPSKKEAAMRLVSSAENSSLDWRKQYAYIEDIGDGRGYTAGIIGFCSGTGDMLELVKYYTSLKAGNPLAAFMPALKSVNGSESHAGLGDAFVKAWRSAASDPLFQQAQDHERDRSYFGPAVAQAKTDGLGALGQFIYYDAMVMHGPGEDSESFGGLRKGVVAKVKPPSQGGDQVSYLTAFLDAREALMRTEEAHADTTRVSTAQRVFLKSGNLSLNVPLSWSVYGDKFSITADSLR